MSICTICLFYISGTYLFLFQVMITTRGKATELFALPVKHPTVKFLRVKCHPINLLTSCLKNISVKSTSKSMKGPLYPYRQPTFWSNSRESREWIGNFFVSVYKVINKNSLYHYIFIHFFKMMFKKSLILIVQLIIQAHNKKEIF